MSLSPHTMTRAKRVCFTHLGLPTTESIALERGKTRGDIAALCAICSQLVAPQHGRVWGRWTFDRLAEFCAKCSISQQTAGRQFQTCSACMGERYCVSMSISCLHDDNLMNVPIVSTGQRMSERRLATSQGPRQSRFTISALFE